jgi:predicted DNA binding CopG/RHH family protein
MEVKMKLNNKEYIERLKNIAKDNEPLDIDEKKEFESWNNLKERDIDTETIEESKNKDKLLEKIKKAQKNGKYSLIAVDKDGNEKVIPKKKPITMNADVLVIEKIKEMSANIGINYQTLINILLKQYADGKINITI